MILATTKSILGWSRSATELRHTAAQRLVDSGATQEELAAFMGHTELDSGLVYYRASASQCELVNKALAISPIYKKVVEIARGRFISRAELAELKGDQQIGGAPHGILITGIGGCSSGQPQCPFNPVTSCYTCRKFMPVRDAGVHEQVLAEFRKIVTFFYQSSHGDSSSPAYLQLRRTLTEIEALIDQVGKERS